MDDRQMMEKELEENVLNNEVKVENVKKVEESIKEEELNIPYMKIKEFLDPNIPIVIWNESKESFITLVEGREKICEYLKKRVNEIFKNKLKEGESDVFSVYVVNDFIKRSLFNYRLEIIVNEDGGLQIVLGVLEVMKRVVVKEFRNWVKKEEKEK